MSVPNRFEPKHVRVNATADGDNSVISGVAGKRIVVLAFALTVTGAGTMTIQDSNASPVIHASFGLAANGGVSFAGSVEAPAFALAKGEGLEINNTAAQDTLGFITYIVI